MVETKSHFFREGGLPSGFALAASMPCSGRNLLPVHIIGMELNLYCLPDDVFHVSSFHGQDPGILKLDTVAQVYAVLSHG